MINRLKIISSVEDQLLELINILDELYYENNKISLENYLCGTKIYNYDNVDNFILEFIAYDFSFQMNLMFLMNTYKYKDSLKNRSLLMDNAYRVAKKDYDEVEYKNIIRNLIGL
jgi:hypothetical protein